MHIQLWDENKDKALKMVKPLYGTAPNRFMNEFFNALDPDSFVDSMKQLMNEDRGNIRLKITVEKININTQIKGSEQ